ncbi:MAG: DUF6242 domain-containing protein [Prevotella conceptionensis]
MKKMRWSLALLFSAGFVFASCLKDDARDITYYDDTAITAFTLGKLSLRVDSTTKDGKKDSVYYRKLDAKKYVFYIDQINKRVYNLDSLPYGVNQKKIVGTFSTRNAGLVTLKSLTSDSTKYYKNGQDSVDFTSERTFVVYSNSQKYSQKYTVDVRVHKQKPNDFKWNQLATVPAFASLQGLRVANAGSMVLVFGSTGSGTVVYGSPIADGKTWAKLSPSFSPDANAWQNAVSFNGVAYVLNGNRVWQSTDGTTWTDFGVNAAGMSRLLGASNAGLHLLKGTSTLYLAKAGTSEPVPETLAASSGYLPQQDFNMVVWNHLASDKTEQVVLLGNRTEAGHAGDSAPVVWGKVFEYGQTSSTQRWAYYNSLEAEPRLPRMSNLQVVVHGPVLLAVGGAGMGASSSVQALKDLYVSADGGLSWRTNRIYTMPTDIAKNTTQFAMGADKDNHIWLVCAGTGKVWRVRKNSVGWATNK